MSRTGRTAAALAGLAVLGAAVFWRLSSPSTVDPTLVPRRPPDLANGERMFRAGSCMACHGPAAGPSGDRRNLPSGGAPFRTPLGTFFPQNLTPDPETGLGKWSAGDFVNAMVGGVSPRGEHYFPAFPYTSYRLVRLEDLVDLFGFLRSLPAVRSPARPSTVPMEALARRGVGLWKRFAGSDPPLQADPGTDASWRRGAYLVDGPGHCGECHTPRDRLMVRDQRRYLAGGPHPAGEGEVPSLRGLVSRRRYKDVPDLVLALRNGESLGYEKLSSGGMASIQESIALLPEDDVRAIAVYLASLR